MKVLITDMHHASMAEEEKVLRPAGIEVVSAMAETEDDLIEKGRGAFAFLVAYAKITRRVMEALPELKVFIKYGIGVDNFDLAAATDLKRFAVNVPDYGVEEVALHALALLLDGVRMVPHFSRIVKAGGWESNPEPHMRYRLSEERVGLAGFGRIAQRLASYMEPMVKEILYFDPYVSGERLSGKYRRVGSLEELFSSCAAVSVHMPLNDETRACIGRTCFEKADGILLVNTSRGGTIHKTDLLAALDSGQIGYFGSDVFFQEPPDRKDPESSLILDHPRSHITPHIAWCSPASARQMRRCAAEEALRVAKGLLPLNVVNKDVLPKVKGLYAEK